MFENPSRRQLLGGIVASGAATMVGLPTLSFASKLGVSQAKTPGLTPEEIAAIELAFGKKGAYNEGQVTHVTPFPRNDLHITVKGQPVPIPLGFGGWAAIKRSQDGKYAVFMSDNVLLEEEINPLIDAALANGLEVNAIHNHFLYENPRIFYMHIGGMGQPAELAAKYAKTIADSKISPRNQPPAVKPLKMATDIFDLAALDQIIGLKGAVNGPSYKYTVGRKDLNVMEMGAEMTAAIGLNTWCTFVGIPEAAIVAGDVAMLGHEVNPVIASLRHNGFEICSVHSHMLTENPRILFMHYLGQGKSTDLAHAFRMVLDMLGHTPAHSMVRD